MRASGRASAAAPAGVTQPTADRRAVPGAKVEPPPGLGHSPLLEDPPRTAALLLAFTTVHAARGD